MRKSRGLRQLGTPQERRRRHYFLLPVLVWELLSVLSVGAQQWYPVIGQKWDMGAVHSVNVS